MSRVVDLSGPRAAMEAGRREEALAAVESILVNAPAEPEAHALRAELLLGLERWEQGLRACEQALALAPGHVFLLRLRCVAFAGLHRFDEQAATAREVLALEPQNANAHYFLAKALIELGRDSDARAELAEAIQLEPDVPLYRLTLARLLFDADPAQAEALLQRIVTDEPNRAAELNDLGVLAERRGELKAAQSLYQRAAAADPQLAAAKQNLQRRKDGGSAGTHYLAMLLFFFLLSGVPFGVGALFYRYGYRVVAGVAFTLAAFLTVAAAVTLVNSTRARAVALRTKPVCSFR